MSVVGVRPGRTSTQRGLRWVVLSLVLALAADAVSFASILAFWSSPYFYAETVLLFSTAFVLLTFACAVPAVLGFRSLRRGRDEFGASHRASLTLGIAGFVTGGAAAAALTLTGIFLGMFYFPAGAYVSGTTYSNPLEVALGQIVRSVHLASIPVIAVFLGIFLIESVWQLATRSRRIVALSAFATGISVPLLSMPPVSAVVYDLLGPASIVLSFVPVASLALWIAVLLLVDRRLQSAVPCGNPSAGGKGAGAPAPPERPPVQPATP